MNIRQAQKIEKFYQSKGRVDREGGVPSNVPHKEGFWHGF